MPKRLIQASWLFALVAGIAIGQEGPCPMAGEGHTSELISYLQRTRSSLAPRCISMSIAALGAVKTEKALEVLVSYLDFIDADVVKQRNDIAIRIGWLEEYPAAQALFGAG